ncbi:polymerase [Duganella sp. FT94W]|uniref:Polymerase n=1 Tax=Duganella lactea TaxID=2692173 RepID=A0ABW9VDB5_9BURK|nr:O-antigen ligase family protein [Duganella lactea]MYM37624.1 polymerase [Duganella lactea]
MVETFSKHKLSEHNRLDRWAFNGLLCLVVWLPLPLASNRSWAIGILLAMVALLSVTVVLAWRRDLPVLLASLRQYRLPLLLLGAFVACAFLQVAPLPAAWVAWLSPASFQLQQAAGLAAGGAPLHLSLDVYQSRIVASLSCAYFFVFVLVLLLVRDKRRLDRLAQVLVWSGLAQAIIGVLLFSAGAHYRLFFYELLHANVMGTFANRNHFAGYMELTLAVGIGLMLARLGNSGPSYSGWRHRVASGMQFLLSPKMRLRLMLVIMVIALVLTRSRMGNTAFFAAMLIVGLISLPLSWRAAPATVALITSLVIVDVVLVGTWVGLDKVVSRIDETTLAASGQGNAGKVINGKHVEDSVEERLLPARYTVQMISDFPVFGTGGGSFYTTFTRYRPPEIVGYYDHVHNDYAEIASDHGLLGGGLLAALVLATFGISLKIMLKRRSSLPRGIAFAAMMSTVALAIHSSVDFNLQIPANALTFLIILALAWVAARLPSQQGGGQRRA